LERAAGVREHDRAIGSAAYSFTAVPNRGVALDDHEGVNNLLGFHS
jgi:hypothetical protein